MMDDPAGKTFTIDMSDQAFRSEDDARIADQIQHLIERHGVPSYLPWWERQALRWGSVAAQIAPPLVVPFIVQKLRQETNNVILPGEPNRFRRYLNQRRESGMRLNVNHLGEAILGEGEAQRRLEAYLELLRRDDIEYISVKISSVFSQINLVAFEETVEAIKKRLRTLYRTAMQHTYTLPDGTDVPKFVNLDMEEYRDLNLTVAAFKQVLDEPEFKHYRAGIVLQAYLPDSAGVQRDLTEWALKRVENGGAPIKMRIVKGANLAMEQVEASSHHWAQAPYTSKLDVDANFKRMVTYGMQPERARAVNLGVASHNLFDVAYALILVEKFDVWEHVEFEMLEGMANHQARAVQNAADGLLLYAPVVRQEDFHSAISYLIRRLDENTAEENFLHDLFAIEVGNERWEKQKALFLQAFEKMNDVRDRARREQNRATEEIDFDPSAPFQNVADTDFSLLQNQQWVRQVRDEWMEKDIPDIPLQIGGKFIEENITGEVDDPSIPGERAYRHAMATPEHVERALKTAVEAQSSWQEKSIQDRKEVLVRCAEELAKRRGDLIGAAMLDGGKRVEESDPEISEAIDFANYYARSLDIVEDELSDSTFEPLGTVLITPPWNFPIAIPAGGALAALMAGNTVIFKPAPETVLVAWELMNAFWDAGVPKDALQFVPTTDDEVGKSLVTDERVNAVILTGAYDTGRMFQSWKPEMRLYAETSGKNNMIITALADHDQAIKDLVKSAFGHNGQKCSAASLAIIEAEIYDNPDFRRQLKDAAESLVVGSAWDLRSFVTPVIREPEGALKRALTTLDEGEEWLLEPKMVDDNPKLWSPGIKLGVKPGSFYHKTECFGPVLGLMRVENLQDAVELANDNEFGLTAGIHSLDDREIDYWRERIEVGNAYINRVTTGAIVRRQPFGGWKKSVFGYAKAGGPNYVLSLGRWMEKNDLDDSERIERAREQYQQAWETHFSVEHDPSQVRGEHNHFRYVPIKTLVLRVQPEDRIADVELIALGAKTCGVAVAISTPHPREALDIIERKYSNVTVVIEGEEAFTAHIERMTVKHDVRLRVLSPVSEAVRTVANAAHVPVIDAPVLTNGRLELRHYLHEQAISHSFHRYGNLPADMK